MALKTNKYKGLFKQPKSIDYQAFMMNDPSKNNNRFVNTCNQGKKNSLGGGFRVKRQEELIQ